MIETKLSEIEDLIQDNWFVYNPNGRDVNEEITNLVKALRVSAEALKEIADTDTSFCIGPRIALTEIERILSAEGEG
jgi:hypothetical protein